MIINEIEVTSLEHLETLIADMDEESKAGVRALYELEIAQGQ